jgi:hypothetical protein
MVYDGYFDAFVPVGSASFDVSLNPEDVVVLPLSFQEHTGRRRELVEVRPGRASGVIARSTV